MEQRTCLLSAAVAATLLVAELATAAEPEAFEPPKGDFITSNTDTRSYAGSLLLVDGICLAHVVGGAYGGFSPALPALGIGAISSAGPSCTSATERANGGRLAASGCGLGSSS